MRKIAFLLGCMISTLIMHAQSPDYIIKDSAQVFGKITFIKDKIQLTQSKDRAPVLYSADEVSEFRAGGIHYKSILNKDKKQFFRQVTDDKIALYKNGATFAILNRDSAVVLERRSFREALQLYNSCPKPVSLRAVSYRKSELKKAVRLLNDDACKLEYFPRPRLGIIAGVGNFNLNVEGENFYSKTETKVIFPSGIYIEFPVYPVSGLSLMGEAMYFNSGVTEFFSNQVSSTAYFDLKCQGVVVPLGFVWNVNRLKLKPYIKVASVLSRINLSSTSDVVYSFMGVNNEVSFDVREFKDTSISPIGFMSSVGLRIPTGQYHNISLEGRYLKMPSTKVQDMEIGFSALSIIVGYNF